MGDSYNAWLTALGGPEKLEKLTRRTGDAIARGPLFHGENATIGAPGTFPFVRGYETERPPYQPWDAVSVIRHSNPATANRRALEELTLGAHGVALELPVALDRDGVGQLLSDIDMTLAPVHVLAAPRPDMMLQSVAELSDQAMLDAGLDPLARAFLLEDDHALEEQLVVLGLWMQWQHTHLPRSTAARASGTAVHDAGGTTAQELAFILASGAAYMRAGLKAGLNAMEATGTICLHVSACPDIHLTVAKMRALRTMWADVLVAFGVPEDAARSHIIARNARRDLQTDDPWTNILRLTTACAGAAMGGADAIILDSFAGNAGQTGFTRRVSRNIQHVVRDEAGLGRVIDPAGGACAHEALTDRLIEESWRLFQSLEAGDGIPSMLGNLREQVTQSRRKLEDDVRRGRHILVGGNSYVDPDPRPVATEHDGGDVGSAIMSARLCAEPGQADASYTVDEGPSPGLLRLHAPFEALRARAGQASDRARAVIATLGPRRAHGARTTWIANRLASGGLETREQPVETADDIAGLNARLVVLSGTDDDTTVFLGTLGESQRARLWVAGALERAAPGASRYVHLRTSLMEDLEAAFSQLEIGA